MITLRGLRQIHRAFGAGLTLLLFSGCAAPMLPPTTQFDGTYVGDATLLRGFGDACGPSRYPLSVPIRNGRFDFTAQVSPWGNPIVPVEVRPDGWLSGSVLYLAPNYLIHGPEFRYAWMTVEGKVAGSTLTVSETDLRCTRRLNLQRQ